MNKTLKLSSFFYFLILTSLCCSNLYCNPDFYEILGDEYIEKDLIKEHLSQKETIKPIWHEVIGEDYLRKDINSYSKEYKNKKKKKIKRQLKRKKIEGIFKNGIPKGYAKWKHIFCPIIKEEDEYTYLGGFHYSPSSPTSIKKIITPPNKHGVFAAMWGNEKNEKYSTFFPEDWDNETVVQKIKEACKNLKEQIGDQAFIGKTKEGIPIALCFKKNPSKNILFLVTAYPIIEDQEYNFEN